MGLRSQDHDFAIQQINYYKYAIDHGYNFVTGYDLVNYEDKHKPILYFIDELLQAKDQSGLDFIFHAGESVSRYNENLYDAILLGTKRIGHSIPLVLHPYLMQLVRSLQIGIEICPLSHWILGYTHDLRWHPAKQLIARNIGVTLSSDVISIYEFNHKSTSSSGKVQSALAVDFALAFLAWELDLKDIKQLVVNSIKYSSISQLKRDKMMALFQLEWDQFINSFIAKQ